MTSKRLQALRSTFRPARIDALLVTFLPHVRYLSGFSGSNALCLIRRSHQWFVTDGRYREQMRQQVHGFQRLVASSTLYELAAERKLLRGAKRVGFEEQYLPVAELRKLKNLFPRITFVPVSGLVEELASVKSEHEIGKIVEAVKLTDSVFKSILKMIKPGVREEEVAAEIGYQHRMLGAEGDAFEPIVASGARGALPHARASSKKIRKGEMVTIDMGCRLQGYHSDLTRTVAVGKPSSEMRRIYAVVHEAQQRAIDAAAAGLPCRSLDAVARGVIKRWRYGKYFSHSLGHGLGLQVHERPRLSVLSRDVLQEGNVVTIEPGVYVPGVGGVRIEDDVVIRRDGCEVLNTSPKELLVL
jgi:Xaa-Pro aminopeptidase